jgi:hypothetical protein
MDPKDRLEETTAARVILDDQDALDIGSHGHP